MLKRFRHTFRRSFGSIFRNKAHFNSNINSQDSYRNKSNKTTLNKTNNKNNLDCVIFLLDNTEIKVSLKKTALGCELLDRVMISLDLIEKDYFGLIFFDKNKQQHWLDPIKTVAHQIKNEEYHLYFRVKFYAIDPDELLEELTRYQFFLQLKMDVINQKIKIPPSKVVDIFAYALQSEIGDYDPLMDKENYVDNYKFISSLTKENIKDIIARHKIILGLTPAECESRFLRLVKNIDFYGIDRHQVKVEFNSDFIFGISPIGIYLIKNEQKVAIYQWNRISKISFRSNYIKILITSKIDDERNESLKFYPVHTSNKELWKMCIEFHSFYRLIKVDQQKINNSIGGLLHFGSKYRYSGKTLFEASTINSNNIKRSISIKRSKSFSSSMRASVGYIRIGSKVWVQAANNEYYKGTVLGLSDKVYVKSDNGESIAHERTTKDKIIYDIDPHITEIQVGTKVIGYWPGIQSYLVGHVERIDGSKFLIKFEDGDSRFNSIQQIRIIKPPMFFGPGSNATYLQKRFSTIRTTSFLSNTSSPNIQIKNKEESEKNGQSTIKNDSLVPVEDRNKPRVNSNPYVSSNSLNSSDVNFHNNLNHSNSNHSYNVTLTTDTSLNSNSVPLKPPRAQGMNGSGQVSLLKNENDISVGLSKTKSTNV